LSGSAGSWGRFGPAAIDCRYSELLVHRVVVQKLHNDERLAAVFVGVV
jgi:hypothetical protein